MPQTCFSRAAAVFLDPWIRSRSKIIPEARAGDDWEKKLKAGAAKKLAGSHPWIYMYINVAFVTLHSKTTKYAALQVIKFSRLSYHSIPTAAV